MNTPDFSGISTRTFERELLKIDAAIQTVLTSCAALNQLAGNCHIDDVSASLDDLNGLLNDALADTINTWRVEVNDELMRRDAAIEARHERIELQNKMGC